MTNPPSISPAWLEDAGGHRVPIRGSCALGRSVSNQVTLPDERISRRHAIIQSQGEQEFWVVDFGSRNGTYLNGLRIIHPTRLRHGDRLHIGSFEFVFRMEKLAGTLGEPRLLSEAAWGRLAALVEAREVGRHSLAGFEGHYLFYAPA